MKLIKKLVTGLMILLVALGSSPLEVFGIVPYPARKEWPSASSGNGTASDLPAPPAKENIVNLSQMFNYPKLDYSEIPRDSGTVVNNYLYLNSYVTETDSSVAVLTRDSTWQAGVMWSKDNYKVKLNEPFHMISYVYLGNKGQQGGGADGITFTMHNDKKNETLSESERKVLAGNAGNYGIDAYGALGNGLGIYGSNFSAADGANRYVYMKRGVTNGIALEFDTFYNDETGLNGKQFSDNDLWSYARPQGSVNSNYGHIAINLLNDIQDNRANEDWETLDPPRTRYKRFSTSVYDYYHMIKHKDMLAIGWDGTITGLNEEKGWQIDKYASKPLADDKWHRLEVKWTPNPNSDKTGDLTYIIYRQGHKGNRNVRSIDDTENDTESSDDILTYTISDLNVVDVFKVNSTADSVYWGFTGSTGGYKNNQAVQMLQLPKPYYKSGIRKVDEDDKSKLLKNAKFELQVLKGVDWETVEFKKADGSGTQNYGSERTNYNIGEKIGFKLSTQIPTNIGITEVDSDTLYYNTFGLIDKHDTSLTFIPDGYELKVPKVADTDTEIVLNDKGETPDYTIVENEPVVEGKATFKVILTEAGIKRLATHGGKFLVFTYTMKLNASAKIDEANVNQVTVEYGRHKTNDETSNDVVTTEGNKKEVYTGGYRFIKTDYSTNKPLADAKFVVRNANDTTAKYLKIEDGTKEISWVTSDAGPTEFITGSDGIVDIKGLTYGTYYLEETKAPTDYVKLSKRIGFDVKIGSYKNTTPVANTPKGFLPSTGGAGIILFVALGAAMVGLAGVYFTSRRKDAK